MKKVFVLFAWALLLLNSCSEVEIRSMMREMSTRDKVAQLLVAHHYDPEIDSLVTRDHIGGVIVMVSSLDEVNNLIPRLKANSKYPLFTCIDAEWGAQMRLRDDYERLPYACEIESVQQAYEVGKQIGAELKELGLAMNLAPVCDVNTNPDNPVIGFRAFGDNVQKVSDFASAYAKGLHSEGIGACAKHFPGHGDTSVDSHKGLPVVNHDRARLDSVELAPFKRMIKEDVDMIMMGHLSVPTLDPSGVPSSISKPIYALLRNELGYKGVIVTDGLMMRGLLEQFDGDDVSASVAAYEAGADMLLGACSVKNIIDAITHKVESGEFSARELDAKVLRVLRLKKKLHIIQ